MIHLITGGSGSGKSAYAEEWLIRKKSQKPFLYVATMRPFGEESREKIRRHQKLRAGKGFFTLECCQDLKDLEIPDNAGILLECVMNLAANEYYRDDGAASEARIQADELVEERVLDGVRHLSEKTEFLAMVTGRVDEDLFSYSEETRGYQRILGRINQKIGIMSDQITEVVYGIPVPVKR